MSSLRAWAWGVVWLAAVGAARGADEPAKPAGPELPPAIRQLMQDRDYDGAVKALDEAAGQPAASRDFLLFLKGRAQHLSGAYDTAIETLAAVEKEFPESVWGRRAGFARGVSFARKGDFREAELIYRGRAEGLLGADRKQGFADIYLEFAETYFKPPKEEIAPDFQKALDFYNQALDVGPKPEKRIEVELQVAKCFQKLGNFAEAVNRLTQFVKDHAGHALEIEARYVLGESQFSLGDPVAARRTWQDLIAAFPEAESERLAEARYALAQTYGMPTPGHAEDLYAGVAALQAFIEKHPTHKLAGQAHIVIAQGQMHLGRIDEAIQTLTAFIGNDRYADQEQVPDARNMLGGALQRQKKYVEALAAWRDYLAKHPTHHAWNSVQLEIINTEYLQGADERERKQYDAARKLWGEFLVKYPLDMRVAGILYQFGLMQYEQEKWDDAQSEWRRLVSKYPNTEESSLAQYMIGVLLEDKLGKLAEALEEYKKCTWGSSAANAQQRIALLTAKNLRIATERVFRSDEMPKIKLSTRNIDRVTVRAYRVDLETYFRKMHLATGVEGLDIALIDPDREFEFEVPKYNEFQQLDSEIEIPLYEAKEVLDRKGPMSGVMAVTVSSKTFEATTLVVQSDLDVIAKSSREEVFVFAENLRTGEPWPNVRLLISNGKQVFAEGKSGDDGVFRQTYAELKDTADVRVFAVSDAHTASNLVSLSGVGIAQGLVDKGYLYTDRPAYRAGQLVHIRGVVRAAQGDVYVVEKDKQYSVDVYDARNRLVRQEKVKLGEFGSFHLHFVLPQAAAPGTYRVLAHDELGHNYQGEFQVHAYQLEPVRLVVDTDRKVFYRGEDIVGKIRAEYYYGAPLADREFRYQLAGGRVETGRTNDKGELEFKFPTREFREAQALPLVVTLPERNLQTGVNFYLATQGYTIGVATPRSVYVGGETFEVVVTTTDAEGKPIAQALTLDVVEQTTVEGRAGEKSVAKHPLETSADDGRGRVTLKLEHGANYVLRVEGIDRFKNRVSGESAVQISDDSDSIRLRILAERHTYKVGDNGVVRLHWREAPALALVTFQGARVLDYKLVRLHTGENELAIPMTAGLAPNFELAVAVMTDPRKLVDEKGQACLRFHEASSPFTVERGLKIQLTRRPKPGNAAWQPGDALEVVVSTTDPQGKPVSAEVGLAMIEQALLDRFAGSQGMIGDFFRGQPREPAVRTTSSSTFCYHPDTRSINQQLLAEEDRVEIARAEAERLREFSDEGLESATRAARSIDTHWSADVPVAVELAAPAAGNMDADADPFGDRLQRRAGHPYGGGEGGAMDLRFKESLGKSQAGVMVEELVSGDMNAPDTKHNASNDFGWHVYFAESDRPQIQEEKLGVLNRYSELGLKDANVLFANGTVRYLNLHQLAADDNLGRILVRQWAEQGAVVLPLVDWQETGYWNPAVVTDASGTATVSIVLPDRSTAWKLQAKGITADTLAGEAEDALAVKKDLFGELKLPSAFTDGDQAEVLATIHNNLLDTGEIKVTLKATFAGKSITETKTVKVTGKGMQEVTFPITVERPASAAGADLDGAFELTVATGDVTDVTRRSVALTPFGMPVYASSSGSAQSDATSWLEPPSEMKLQAQTLQIIVGPTVERSLLDIVLGESSPVLRERLAYTSGIDSTTSDLMAAVGLQELIGAAREAAGPESNALDERIRSALGLLIAAQNDDGGWSWTGKQTASDRFTSARVLWAMSLARAAGYAVPADAFDRAANYLQTLIAQTAEDDYETKAVLLHALATADRGDFTLANRLYRNRPALSNAALAHLALAFVAMQRNATAGELLAVLAERNLDDQSMRREAALGCLPWNQSSVELRALYAFASMQIAPQSPKTRELVNWLMEHRTGNRWAPDKATGPATVALAKWFAAQRFAGEHYKLSVFVNDTQVEVVDVDENSGTRTIEVPIKFLKEGKQRVNFQLAGRGRFTYQCVLSGFVPAGELKGTSAAWGIERHHEPAPLEFDGQPVSRGFGILEGSYQHFRNPLTQLPVGRRGLVEINLWRQNLTGSEPEEQLEYLVVTEPIPAGTTVIEQSITGGFERYEISPGAITFYIGTRRYIEGIRYEVHGYLPGKYRALQTVLRSAYRPDQFVTTTVKDLAVLPLGAQSADEYRLTPQELYELGKRHFERHDYQASGKHLQDLFTNWKLQADPYKDTARMLLDIHLETGPDREIVRFFEIIKEKWPDLELTFDKIIRVGAAYDALGEYERAYLVFRATVENSFLRESAVPAFLEGQGEFLRSVDVMRKTLGDYPPEPYVAAATYSLAQRVFSKAPTAADDPKLREKKVNRVDLVRQAAGMLNDFLTQHSDDPAADQASFSVAAALLELKAFREAITSCERYAVRYPKSKYVDSYWYVIGYSHFSLGEHEQALQMCRKVAEAKFAEPNGVERESNNRWQAVYILGQVYHSLGKAAEAILEYTRVADRFPDAAQAIQYFVRKEIALPEVSTIRPGEPATVELKFRNVAACDVKVYRIDLLKYSLLNRNLGNITQINLAGIRPFHEVAVALGDGQDYRDRTQKLELPMKDEGAYLVVCRGEDLHASGLVLITPLGMEIQEEASSGRVRATVKNVLLDKFVADVHVKAIGSANSDFTSGETDLRGVFVADGITGQSTVIARLENNRYAFYRGQHWLGQPPAPTEAPQQQALPTPSDGAESKQKLEGQLLDQLYESNSMIQSGQNEYFDKNFYQQNRKGVQAAEAAAE
ncbi:MAG: tetratricopeptide repeat protein [Planctomycetia bacterium]|nr:tetratricopeptide repeat protein [Planctomycetia bacterium]